MISAVKAPNELLLHLLAVVVDSDAFERRITWMALEWSLLRTSVFLQQ